MTDRPGPPAPSALPASLTSPTRPLDRPVAAEIVEIVPEGSAGHSLWLAPRTGWRTPPDPGQFLMLWLPRPPAAPAAGAPAAAASAASAAIAETAEGKPGPGPGREVCDNIPMSIAGWEPGRLKVTIAGVGPTTNGLLQCRVGELLGVTGPLGQGFRWQAGDSLLLVAGGVGAPPLGYLAERARADGCRVHTLLGARTEGAIFARAALAEHSDILLVATDDGSAGHHGFVTELLEGAAAALAVTPANGAPAAPATGAEEAAQARPGPTPGPGHPAVAGPDLLAACGPEPMLARVLDWAEARRPAPLPTQLCLERHMSCGIGVCGVCTIDELLVCRDGPVLTGEQLRGSREFG